MLGDEETNDIAGKFPEMNRMVKILTALHVGERITEEERREFNQWLASDTKNREWLSVSFREKIFGKLNAGALDNWNTPKALSDIRRQIGREKRSPFPGKAGREIYAWGKTYPRGWRLAAVFLIIGGFSLFVYNASVRAPKGDPAKKLTFRSGIDLPPASARALLSLEDNRVVTLDSSSASAILHYPGLQVSPGRLSYPTVTPAQAKKGYHSLTTPRGGVFTVRLPDGSHVWLNAASSIKYPTVFTRPAREVTLTGEAYFEVMENTSSPFIVHANGSTIQVLGTHFNIMAYPEEPGNRTTLLEGAVKVGWAGSWWLLKPGDQARMSVKDGLRMIPAADTAEAIAWRQEVFRFHHVEVQTAVRELGRWYNARVVVAKDVPLDTIYADLPRNLHLSKALEILTTAANKVDLQEADKTIFVTARKKP